MSTQIYRFQVGAFHCISLADGYFNYPVAAFFSNAPEAQLEAELRQHGLPTGQIGTPYTCLYVDTGEHHIMIDTGAGPLGELADKIFPGLDHSTTMTGSLIHNLALADVDPTAVDIVIITHAHPDHIGGTLDSDGRPVFSNAAYFIARREWEFWTSPSAPEQTNPAFVEEARKNLYPVRERLTLIDDGMEIVPGIHAVAAPGHTPGHIALAINSEADALLHISDTVLHPIHLEQPDWLPVFDMSAADAGASKQRIFDRAAAEQLLLFAHHFPPFPNLGHVVKREQGWLWRPLERS